MEMIKKILKIVGIYCLLASSAFALAPMTPLPSDAAYQVFANIAYSNPAALTIVTKGQFIIGGTGLFSRYRFSGKAGTFRGSAVSEREDLLPYGRLAYRLGKKVVVGLDVTEPFFVNIKFPKSSIVRFFSTRTLVRSVDISPKISYQVNEKLSLGLGLNMDYIYNAQLNLVIPPFGNLVNKATRWGYGWDVGLFYVLTKATYLNLSYYSKIVQHLRGVSAWAQTARISAKTTLPLPATTTLNLIQYFSKNFLISATLRYIEWHAFQFLTITPTPLGPLTLPEHYRDSWDFQLATRYTVNDKWALLASLSYASSPQPTKYRPIGLPTHSVTIPAVGAIYNINKILSAQLLYAHGTSNPRIKNLTMAGLSKGHVNVNVDAIDLNLTWNF